MDLKKLKRYKVKKVAGKPAYEWRGADVRTDAKVDVLESGRGEAIYRSPHAYILDKRSGKTEDDE